MFGSAHRFWGDALYASGHRFWIGYIPERSREEYVAGAQGRGTTRCPTGFFSVGVAEGRFALPVRKFRRRPRHRSVCGLLEWAGDQIALIRGFKFAPYVRESLVISNPET